MQGRHEKITYENDRGESIEIAYSFPFFFELLAGADGTHANITKAKSIGQDGSTITDVTLADRELRITGSILGYSKEEIARHRAKLLRVFNPKIKGTMQYEYGDIKRQIRCQIEAAPRFKKKTRDYRAQEFIIDLIAPTPFWQDVRKIKEEVAIWQGLFEFPLEITTEGIEMGFREPSLIVNIFNPGDVPCGIWIRFRARASVENPSLFNVNTREELKVNKILEAGETLTVTTHFANKRVEIEKQGVVESAFQWLDLDSTFLQLNPGDNLFRYDADDGLDNLEVDIYFTPQYVGV